MSKKSHREILEASVRELSTVNAELKAGLRELSRCEDIFCSSSEDSDIYPEEVALTNIFFKAIKMLEHAEVHLNQYLQEIKVALLAVSPNPCIEQDL